MQPRGGSVFSKGHFSVLPSSSLLVFVTALLSLVGNTLTTPDLGQIQTPNPLDQDNTMVPFNFPENSTRSVVTASEDLLKKILNTIPSEAEDMQNSKVNKSYATIDRDDGESPLSKENVTTQVTATTTTTIPSTTNALTTIKETTLMTTTTETPTTTTTISSTTVTNIPTTITTTTTTMEVTDPPEAQTEESSAFIEENEKMPSGIIVLVTMITFAVVAVIGYVSLIVWRRYLEYRYGNRELLVNDLEFDTNDLRHFEL